MKVEQNELVGKIKTIRSMIDIDQDEFATRVGRGSEHWNQWVEKIDTPNQLVKVKITTNLCLSTIISAEGFNGFKNFDFSKVMLWIEGLNFEGVIQDTDLGHKYLFHNLKGLHSLWLYKCFDKIPSLWLEGIEIGQIVIKDCESIGSLTIINCSITSEVSIDNTIMDGLRLSKCKFSKLPPMACLTVGGVEFKHSVLLNGSLFDSLTRFKSCIFQDTTQVVNVTFNSFIEFINCEFVDYTDFQNTMFEVPPRFNGSSLNSQTLFPKEENFKVIKTEDKSSINSYVSSFQLLKNEASKSLDRRNQGMFFSLEQKYLRLSNRTSIFEKGLSLAYQVSSNYGRSVLRPIYGLILLSIIYGAFYALLKSETVSLSLPFSEEIIINSIKLSLGSIFLPFKLIMQDHIGVPIILLSISQSLISLSLVTLSLLALRWNFRRD